MSDMDIEALIKQEAPEDSAHDRLYAAELRAAFEAHNKPFWTKARLESELIFARRMYRKFGPTQYNTARCVMLYALLQEAD